MPPPLRPSDVVVGMLTENTTRMLTQAVRLLRSIRWFGGELAKSRIVVCGVGPLESTARRTIEELGAEVRTVPRFHPANPHGNRHSLLAELLDAPEQLLFLLDCDTLIVQDPLPFLHGGAFQAKLAAAPTVSDPVFDRLFAHFDLKKPARSFPYFNTGVLAIPTEMARTLAPPWRRYDQVLADQPELVAPCQHHMHQAALAIALAETGVPVEELPWSMNDQINATHLTPPPRIAETDPVIIHYHHLDTDDGYLLPASNPGTQKRIELFHERMKAEGFARSERTARATESSPVVVLGMHRSGTSLVTQLANALGLYAGSPDQMTPPDLFNPTGYWEHRELVAIDSEVLDRHGIDWTGIVDLSRITDEARSAYVSGVKRVAGSLQGFGSFVLKDPRMALLIPLWREALGEAVCIIVWRHPMAVARSLAHREKRQVMLSLSVWEHYNRRILRDTEGLRRVLVSYEELLAEPMRVATELHAALESFGLEGLSMPSEEAMRQIVQSDFNRSGGDRSGDDVMLDEDQRALLADLQSGAVLHDAVAPMSPRALKLLEELGEFEKLNRRARDLDELLRAVFESRSWRLGYGLTTLTRRKKSVSAIDRWRELKRRPL